MKNVLKELKYILEKHKLTFEDVVCADIERGSDYYKVTLKQYYIKEDLNDFLNKLDFEYDDSLDKYEFPETDVGLYGLVWLTNNRWLERGGYNNCQHWVFKEYPTIPGFISNPELWDKTIKEFFDNKRKELNKLNQVFKYKYILFLNSTYQHLFST